jgi:hypothetical protein
MPYQLGKLSGVERYERMITFGEVERVGMESVAPISNRHASVMNNCIFPPLPPVHKEWNFSWILVTNTFYL